MPKKKEDPKLEVKQDTRDPILDVVVKLEMKVEDVNHLLSLLAELPYKQSADVLNVIRNEAIQQVTAHQKAQETPPEA